MKKTQLITLFISLLTLSAWAQTPAGKSKAPVKKQVPLDLKVKMKGVTGGYCILAHHYGDKQLIQDSVKVGPDGTMEFKDTAAVPGGIYMVFTPDRKKYFEVILTDNQKFSLETDTADFVNSMKVTGNDENKFFYEYLVFLTAQQKKVQPLQDALAKARADKNADSVAMLTKKISDIDSVVKQYKRDYYQKKHPETFMAKVLHLMDEPDPLPKDPVKYPNDSIYGVANYWNFRNHYWDGMDFSDDRLMYTPVYASKLKFYLDKLIPQHPDSITAACDDIINRTRPSKELFKYTLIYTTYNYESSKIMGYDAIFVHLVETYYRTGQVWWVGDEQMTKILNRSTQLSYSLIGKPAINLMLQDSNGVVKPLGAVNAKYTVVIFWDPTCSHCKKEVPVLKHYYDSLRTAGVSVQVYAVYSELDYKGWKAYIKEHNLNWINVCGKDAQELGTAKYYYDVYSTPTIYLLNDKKEILGKRFDVDGLQTFLNRQIMLDQKKTAQGNNTSPH
ncbi:MAG TPA: thioredoxin-like domain-containing protein [Bacteroidia bacterium]|nr:thioredoxin-like domain-containing protein [Bacteroidia bacterium]